MNEDEVDEAVELPVLADGLKFVGPLRRELEEMVMQFECDSVLQVCAL